ncbi:helix-turn-helix domain-containing protein [Lactococcus garvieae]|uniref:helix-turn-helix domain-containing protein n=1 Tax=Lactococcus garvieae TaxID=1363 RepID=UPI0018DA3529|nr:Rgg/GadR/MutR family transcriptional regulator [Lactococcus garvieae]QPS71191.1 Rgg/GadR/MutR family transcriptional regulator [Lactococcus garvieae]
MQTNLPLGETYKYFRTSKNFPLKEAARECISISQLSNFERGKSIVSSLVLFHLLENINVSFHEFFYHLQYCNSHLNLLEESNLAYSNNNLAHLKAILKKYESIIPKNPTSKNKLQMDKTCIELAISILDTNYELNTKNIQVIKQYLNDIKLWGEYEISLLGTIASILDLGTLSKFSQRMLAPIQKKINNPLTHKIRIHTSIDILSIFIKNKQFTLSEELIYYLETLKFHEYDLFEKIYFTYQKAHFEVTFGNRTSLTIMKQCQLIFEFSEFYQIAQKMDEEIENVERSLK